MWCEKFVCGVPEVPSLFAHLERPGRQRIEQKKWSEIASSIIHYKYSYFRSISVLEIM